MPDAETKKLDLEILSFIRKYSETPAPDPSFDALALKSFRYQFTRNANYRGFCLVEGKKPKNVKHWREIPAMPAAGFKELVLATFPAKKTVRVFKTSGTSRGNTGAHFFDTLKLYRAAVLPPFKKYLAPESADLSFFYLIHSPKEAPNSSLSYMVGVVNRHLARSRGTYYIRRDRIDAARLVKDLSACRKPAAILSTAFSLKAFLDFSNRRGISLKLPAGSRLMETGGFKGRAEEVSKAALYRSCQKLLSIDKTHCVSEYGMTELSSQFYDTTLRDQAFGVKRRPFKAGPAWVRTLVIDSRTGKEARKGSVGVLRHFDLANRGSVMAIQTEDLGRVVGEGFELIGRVPTSDLRGCSLSYEEFLKS